ncbi:MAG: T9SS type A sorting domain-containing protein, partial [Polaribacter sp.]|nr:T9SS type A sorting domain-containing protein [Polaribacter sp.]
VDNPVLDGVNATASKVMKVFVGPGNAFYAGVNNKWEDSKFGSWKIDMSVTSNLTLTMDVNKNYVGTVGIKMGTNSAGTSFQITNQNVGNTVVNEWQTLTFDLSGINPNGDLSNISQMVVFVDWTQDIADRAEGNTIYIDNIKFNAEKLTDAPVVPVSTGNPEGTWKLSAKAGAMGVGPSQGDIGWWSNSAADVTTRACLFDDEYVFESNGTFKNELGDDTWVEGWQGGADGCATPVAPHNNSNAATWVYDSNAKTITISGKGAYLGIAKPHNGGELTNSADAPASITYIVTSISDTEMTLDLNYGGGFWRFLFTKNEGEVVTPTVSVDGTWMLSAKAGALGVGASQGDTGWWSNSDADVTGRACLFDDEYVFESNGTFENILGADTWIEGWQGGGDSCGAPVAPHNNSSAATWTYDATAGTITITGKGAYLGIPKPNNGGELTNPADAPNSITYLVSSITDTEMTLDLNYGGGFWRFLFTKKDAVVAPLAVDGTWKLSPKAGALGVGASQGDTGWWASNVADVTGRACLFDDEYVFESNGTFENILGANTWIEGWQGGGDSCGAPVAPHNNSSAATWTYDATAGTITITGKGAYLGIPKPHNGGELSNPVDAPASITYLVSSLTETEMTLDLNYGGGFWRFLFTKQTATASVDRNDVVSLKMYPNPTTNTLNISAANTIENAQIYNVLGKKVMSLNINKTSESIDVSNLASGVYLIKYQVNKAIGTSKFIKQ